MCPYGGRQLGGEGGLFSAATLVAHCLLVESNLGLVLVDTGFGLDDVAHARSRLGSGFVLTARPRLDPAECALRQVERLGFSGNDVRHIVVTHLDLDHAGGLRDFPKATVHVHAGEHEAAMRRRTFLEKERYKKIQWAHSPLWKTHLPDGERWFGFDAVRPLDPSMPDVLLVPLFGHTRGHSAVAVRDDSGWLLHCGDAYFSAGEREQRPHCPPLLAYYQKLVAIDDETRVHNQGRLRDLARDHSKDVRMFSAHSADEYARFTGQAAS